MGLFSSARGKRAKRAADPEATNGNGAAAPPSLDSPSRPMPGGARPLRELLQQLYSIRPSREVFAEEAIKIIAKGAGVKAAALLGYEPRHNRMKLLGQVGLEREQAHILGGESSGGGWDIPIRSVRNRRINVIESAHENPFVPKILAAINPRRLTIATIPFYHANTPIGVIVLFSPTQRGFADGLLQSLSQGLRVCALALAELPASASIETAKPVEPHTHEQQPNLLRGLAALKGELARLTQALEETERQRATEAAERVTAQSFLQAAREKSVLLEQEIAELRGQLEQLPALEEQIRTLNQRLHDAVEGGERERARANHLEKSLQETEDRVAGGDSAVQALTVARDDLQAQLDVAVEAARERNEALDALEQRVAELTARTERLDELQQSLETSEKTRTELESEIRQARQTLAAAQAELEEKGTSLREATTAVDAARKEIQGLVAELDRARHTIDELSSGQETLVQTRRELESLADERDELKIELDQARAALDGAKTEHDKAVRQWRDRVAQLEKEHGDLQAQIGQLHGQSKETIAELQAGAQVVAQERQDLLDRIRALEEVQSERDRLRERVEDSEQELAAAQDAKRALEARVEELGQVSTRLIAERRELHERIEKLAAGGQTLEQEKQSAINAAQRRVTEVEEELSRVASTLKETRTAAAAELQKAQEGAARSLAEARQEIEAANRERDELRRKLDAEAKQGLDHQRALEAREAEQARLQKAFEKLQAERSGLDTKLEAAHGDLERLTRQAAKSEKRLQALDKQLESSRDELLADAQQRLAAAEQQRESSEKELEERHSAEIDGLQAQLEDARAEFERQLREITQERDRLTELLAEKELLLRSAEEGLTLDLSEVEDEGEESILAIDRSTAPEHEGGAADEEVGEEQIIDEVVLFDEGEIGATMARQLAEYGHKVTTLVPEPEATGQLGERPFACVAINLAIASAWRTLRSMRGGDAAPRLPLIGYALPANAKKGFWLGAVDFTTLPVDKNRLADNLNRLVPKVRRVIAMSNDIDVMSDVRTQLTAAKISTAVVLDGRQALDLVSTVRPEAAVLHLSPSCVDVFRAIAGLRTSEIGRDIPILFLLDGEPQPREEAFLTAGIRMLSGRGNLEADSLVDSLASAFNPYCGFSLDTDGSATPGVAHERLSAMRDS